MKRAEDVTMVDRLLRRAAELPDETVFHLIDEDFFVAGPETAPAITYGALSRRAAATAAVLQEQLAPGERVLLPFAGGLEFMAAFYGCLYAGVVPVPAYPPRRGLQADPLDGLRRIAHDCQPKAAITGGQAGSGILRLVETDPQLSELWWFTTESVDEHRASDWQTPAVDGDSLALLQYTSGSTGMPRGVAVTHDNIMSNNRLIERAFHHQTHLSPQRGVCWLPFHHDMGLMGNVIHPVYAHIPVYFMTPMDFLRRPLRWLQAVSTLGPVTSGGPGFAYDLCVRKITEEQKATLDLSDWRIAYIGADRIHAGTIRAFVEAFASCGLNPESLYPCYGLAESTLFVTGGDWQAEPIIRRFDQPQPSAASIESATDDDRMAGESTEESGAGRELVACGRPWPELGLKIAIVDPQTDCRMNDGEIGEIRVAGTSVANGYWNQPQVTSHVFESEISGESQHSWLRTGDLGFLRDGQLYVTGRLKDVIIIRGRNYHPADIESVVVTLHDAFRPESTVAIGLDIDGEERLVILQEVDRRSANLDPESMAGRIRQRVAEEFQLQASVIEFLKSGSLPKTSSGKLKRFACRKCFEAGTLQLWKEPVNE